MLRKTKLETCSDDVLVEFSFFTVVFFFFKSIRVLKK